MFSEDSRYMDFIDSLRFSVLVHEYQQSKIRCVIFNKPATVVFWEDGTKTVVKTSPHDEYDKEKGVLWAFYLKYAGGSKTKLQKTIAKLVEGDIR